MTDRLGLRRFPGAIRLSLLLIALLSIMLGGCGSDAPAAGPEEPSTVAELDAAVHAAAQKLLDRERVAIAVIYFGFDDPEQMVRYDWIDYRPDDAVLAVYKYLDADTSIGLSLSEGRWAIAQVSDEQTHPWREEPTLGPPVDVVPAVLQLIEMTERTTPESSETDAALINEVTRQGASDGSELWTLVMPRDESSTFASAQWLINPDGVLNFYRIYSDAVPLTASSGAIVYEFGAKDEEPDPLIVPALDTPLRLDDLGLPIALRNLEE